MCCAVLWHMLIGWALKPYVMEEELLKSTLRQLSRLCHLVWLHSHILSSPLSVSTQHHLSILSKFFVLMNDVRPCLKQDLVYPFGFNDVQICK